MSQMDLTAVFSPMGENDVNYSVVCRVKRKPTPLRFNVKGEGYALHQAMHLEMADGSTLELAAGAKGAANAVDFGQVRWCCLWVVCRPQR